MSEATPLFRKILKTVGLLALSCAIFLTGCFIVDKIWGITFDTRTFEVLVAALIILHVAVPSLHKRLAERVSRRHDVLPADAGANEHAGA